MFKRKSKLTENQVAAFFTQMQAFHWGFLQDVVVFLKTLRNKHIPLAFAVECIMIRQGDIDASKEKARADQKKYMKKAKRCPDCGQVLTIMPIRDPEGPSNRKGYKSAWVCTKGWHQDDPDKFCGYHSFSTLTMQKILKKMGIKPNKRGIKNARRSNNGPI